MSENVTPTIEDSSEVSSVVAEKVIDPITAKIAELAVTPNKTLKAIYAGLLDDTQTDKFKALMIALGLYVVDSNQAEVDKFNTLIASAKELYLASGFELDSDFVKGAIKGMTTELNKAQGKVVDNMPQLTAYFGVKSGKAITRSNATTGDLATHRPSISELKTTDFVFAQSEKKSIVVHSSTIAESDLTKLGQKSDSQLWLSFEYNSVFSFDRTRHQDNNGKMVAVVKTMPENWVKVTPVIYEGTTLSGLMGKVASGLGLPYNGNGWQSCSMLVKKFDKVGRVVKEG